MEIKRERNRKREKEREQQDPNTIYQNHAPKRPKTYHVPKRQFFHGEIVDRFFFNMLIPELPEWSDKTRTSRLCLRRRISA